MKISQHWLKQFLHGADKANTAVWADRLTFAGIEIEGETDHVWDVSLTPNRGDCFGDRSRIGEFIARIIVTTDHHVYFFNQ